MVDPEHADASDDNDGSASRPWRSIARALDAAMLGTTVIVRSGRFSDAGATWQRGFNPARSGVEGAPIVIRAEPRGAATFVAPTDDVVALGLYHRSYVVLEGFRIEGMLKMHGCDHITLRDNDVVRGGIEDGDVTRSKTCFTRT